MSDFLPRETAESKPFWDGCRAGQLLLQRCDACGRLQFYPRAVCVHCGGTALTFTPVSGRGVVHAATVVHRPLHPRFAERVPYVVALVELDEGPRMMTNIIGCDPAEVRIGLAVQVAFTDIGSDVTLPFFTPVAAA